MVASFDHPHRGRHDPGRIRQFLSGIYLSPPAGIPFHGFNLVPPHGDRKTIVGALLIGVSREVAAEFTFFLAIPAMFGASLIKLMGFGLDFTGTEFGLLMLGCVVSFGLSVVAIRFLVGYIKKHDFKVFGYYRIVLGGIIVIATVVQALLA